MPHKQELRHIRVTAFDDAALRSMETIGAIRTSKMPLPKKLRAAVKLRRTLVDSLKEMKTNKDHYDFGQTQLKVLDILLSKARTAKKEEDLFDIWRMTCYLKLEKK
jgi:hypothetical protein